MEEFLNNDGVEFNDEGVHSKKNRHATACWNCFPPGYRFMPSDQELVGIYLKKKINNEPLPEPNPFVKLDVRLHDPNPKELADLLSFVFFPPTYGACYFFTLCPNPNRERSNPSTDDGYWKAARDEAEAVIDDGGNLIGNKKVSFYYKGGEKTNWIMHEYTLIQRNPNDLFKSDGWVLRKIYEDTHDNKDDSEDTHDDKDDSEDDSENTDDDKDDSEDETGMSEEL